MVGAVLSLFLLVTKRLYGKEWEWSIGQIKTCRKKQHVKIDDIKEMSDLICGKAAVGGNYNSTRDTIEEPTKIEEQPAHEHSYSWVTVQEASTGQDGIEEYRCSCGAVAERNVIPAGMAMVKDLVVQIETAPENSTVEIKTEYFTCYTAYIMNALRKRPDVSLKTTFKDYDKDGSIKTFTIPAGKVPDDNELFYGFTYLGNLYGWDE